MVENEQDIKRMTEAFFGVKLPPENRGTDGKKPVKSPPKPAPVSEPDAGRQPGSGRDGVLFREAGGVKFTARNANDVFKASSSKSTSSRIPRRR